MHLHCQESKGFRGCCGKKSKPALPTNREHSAIGLFCWQDQQAFDHDEQQQDKKFEEFSPLDILNVLQ